MVAELVHRPHPVTACAEQISSLLADITKLQAVYVRPDDQRAALLAITDAERRLAELKLRVMAVAGEVAEADGARDIAGGLTTRTNADLATARAEQRLAKALDTRWARVAAGMAAGVVSMDQARVIVHGLEALPVELGAEVVEQAEERHGASRLSGLLPDADAARLRT